MFGQKKKAKAKVELVSVETEEEFHAALIVARTWNSRMNSLRRSA